MKQAFNPILPSWEYVPDGEPRVFGDRVYLYGSHDQFDGADFCLNDYVGWSAPVDDLTEWRCEGIIYRATQDPRNADGKMHMCAPDCVQGIDGRYYLYYQLHILQCTSVAVADTPAGPFEFYGYVKHPDGTPWGEKKGDVFAFDPGVLVDGGKAYIYVGFGAMGFMRTVFKLRGNNIENAACLELESDMLTVKGQEHFIAPGQKLSKGTAFEGHAFFEASSIRKIGDKYYYVYSSELSHELCYAISDRPDGGFEYGGTLVSIADIGYKGNKEPLNYTGNTHGGMAEINGQWYIFYHRQTNRIRCSRQACAEKIEILEDGSIAQVEVTSCGLNMGPLKAKGCYEARIACNLGAKSGMVKSDDAKKTDKKGLLPYFTQEGKDREGDGNQYIANMQDGAFCAVKYLEFDGSEKDISIKARGDMGGVMKVFTDFKAASVAEIKLEKSEEYKKFSSVLNSSEGIYPLYFKYEGAGALDFIEFEIS